MDEAKEGKGGRERERERVRVIKCRTVYSEEGPCASQESLFLRNLEARCYFVLSTSLVVVVAAVVVGRMIVNIRKTLNI